MFEHMIISRPTKRSNINMSPNCHNNDHRHKHLGYSVDDGAPLFAN
jgi:hypothetical protein